MTGTTTTKSTQVAIALIWQRGRVLVALRPDHVEEGGRWEFPGGKVEASEQAEDAVVREVREELGVASSVLRRAWTTDLTRAGRRLVLHFFHVALADGAAPQPLCSKALDWREPTELLDLPFCSADTELLVALRSGQVAAPI